MRQAAVEAILERNPNAFRPKIQVQCPPPSASSAWGALTAGCRLFDSDNRFHVGTGRTAACFRVCEARVGLATAWRTFNSMGSCPPQGRRGTSVWNVLAASAKSS